MTRLALILAAVVVSHAADTRRSWASDNGNGTYSNPLFYDEFSDPDMIRVGPDYYLNGTTMHAMPGLPILHSRDLVNWRCIAYAFDRLDLGPDFRLEGGKEIYGQGIWAPSFRYSKGTYYIGQRIVFEDLATGNVLALVHGKLHSAASALTAFKVVDRGRGRIALHTASGHYLSAADPGIAVTSAQPGDAETFQWVDLQRGDTLLLSLATHSYVVVPKSSGPASADHPGPAPDRKDGSCFQGRFAK